MSGFSISIGFTAKGSIAPPDRGTISLPHDWHECWTLEHHGWSRDARLQGLDTFGVCVLDAFENLYFSVALAPLFAIVLEAVPVDHCG